MTISVKVTGLSEVEKTFRNLPVAAQNKAFRPALRKGANVVRKAASENVAAVTGPEATGLLEKSIKVYGLKRFRGMLRMGVMVKRGLVNLKGVRVGLYASVLEYGKENQPPRSWIRKAAKEKISPAYNAIVSELEKRMKKAVDAAKAGSK